MRNLDELDALDRRATPGPWWVERPLGEDAFLAYGHRGDPSETYDLYEAYNVDTDYESIVAARNALSALIAELEAARRLIAAQRALAQLSDIEVSRGDWWPAWDRACQELDAAESAYDALTGDPNADPNAA